MRYILLGIAAVFAALAWIYSSSDGGKLKYELKSSAAAEYSVMPH
jgi:hypothetical protein